MPAISAVLPSPESAPLASEAISRLPHPVCNTPKAPARVARITSTSAKSVHPSTRKTRRTGLGRRVSVEAASVRLSDADIDLDDVVDTRAAVERDADVRAQGTDPRTIAQADAGADEHTLLEFRVGRLPLPMVFAPGFEGEVFSRCPRRLTCAAHASMLGAWQ